MPILTGFHVEGNDHLILHAFVAKVLLLPEEEILLDFVDAPGRGWKFVLEFIPNALKRFYGQCAQFAVIGIDNDGNVDLDQAAVNEDPHHPRHDNHPGATVAVCRYCMVAHAVARVRHQLNWIQKKPSATWPILIAVPVEMIETWLLTLQGKQGVHRRPRGVQKQVLYGKPVATRADVTNVALPLVRSMTADDVVTSRATESSRSNVIALWHTIRQIYGGPLRGTWPILFTPTQNCSPQPKSECKPALTSSTSFAAE